MATFTKFNAFVEDLAEKAHNLASDSLKLMLTNSAPSASNTVTSDLTEISAGNGYTAGGNSVTVSSSSQTSGTYKLVLADSTFTASGGSIGPFRYVVLYNASNSKLIGWWDNGSSITLSSGSSFTTDFDASAGVFTIA